MSSRPASELPKVYSPSDIERRRYDAWEESGAFRAEVREDKKPFSIVLPPPNVTGVLHIGHAFDHLHQDLYVRRARMLGLEALWVPGTDHAGIATQNVVERQLAQEGTDRDQLGRDAFVKRVWEWREQSGGQILQQMRRLGDSCDWDRTRFTMDEGLSRAVRTVFVRWFDDGLIYRGLRIINWCPRCTTALSDIEVEHDDVAGELVTFPYEFADGSGSIRVATTRVETMLGDTGVIVHPDDQRYTDAVGKRVVHPFFPDREMPVVADAAVDPEFGTGAVKATPAHDPLDFEIGERTGLEKINILDEHARINENGGRFAGLDRYEARKSVLEELKHLGLVEEERPYVHAVGHCYRCHTEIEPWLSEQWFVRMAELAGPALEAVRDGRIRIVPDRFRKAYEDWMENIRDWCISRQIWWGHRIPVFYCDECGHAFAALEDPVQCAKCDSSALRQDPDVLDTWFSSQLWPFSTLGWPQDNPDLEYFYPTSIMVTGYEILYLWVARMIMSGLYFMKDVPFHEVLIHGIVRDFEGKKMSKSLGNVIDPLDMIDRYGADALRFALAFAAVPGNDTNVSEERIEWARNFANKLWNAARYVFISAGTQRPELDANASLAVEDRWILSRLDAAIGEVNAALDSYNLAEAMRALHRFIWSEYCDWYIELSKLRTDDTATAVLLMVLDRLLRLLHPVMPFITEELWEELHPGAGSIMTASWPAPGDRRDVDIEATAARFQELVNALRRVKDDYGINQSTRVPAIVAAGHFRTELDSLSDAVVSLARLEGVDFVDELPPSDGAARTVTPAGIEAVLDLGTVVDPKAERERLTKKLATVEETIRFVERKLRNADFVAKAPVAVVEKERKKLDEAAAAGAKLRARLDALGPE